MIIIFITFTGGYEEDIYPDEAFDFHDYRSSNSSVNHLTPRRHRREMEEGTRRRRCRRKGVTSHPDLF